MVFHQLCICRMCSEMLALALYKCHLDVAGWSGIEDSLDERDRIRKTTLDFGVWDIRI